MTNVNIVLDPDLSAALQPAGVEPAFQANIAALQCVRYLQTVTDDTRADSGGGALLLRRPIPRLHPRLRPPTVQPHHPNPKHTNPMSDNVDPSIVASQRASTGERVVGGPNASRRRGLQQSLPLADATRTVQRFSPASGGGGERQAVRRRAGVWRPSARSDRRIASARRATANVARTVAQGKHPQPGDPDLSARLEIWGLLRRRLSFHPRTIGHRSDPAIAALTISCSSSRTYSDLGPITARPDSFGLCLCQRTSTRDGNLAPVQWLGCGRGQTIANHSGW